MESEKNMNNQDHVHTPGHCCTCAGCGSVCMRDGVHGMKRYWVRHFVILILGVIAAFFVGERLGEMKGYIMSSYGGTPLRQGWMMDRDRNDIILGVYPTGGMPIQGAIPESTTTPTGR